MNDQKPMRLKAERQAAQESTLPRPVQDALGARLRAMYEHVRAEPVPDRFVQLLKSLEKPRESEDP